MHKTEGDETLSVKGGCLVGLSREMMKGAVHIWVRSRVVELPDGVKAWEGEPGDVEAGDMPKGGD